jgi:uncharacterized membrane protein YjgN (DUF898 family)
MHPNGDQDGFARLTQHGKTTEFFTIWIVNLLLKAVTLGIYHFWAKTRVRRYLWTQTELDGERFEYHGRGLELFYGFLLAVIMIFSLMLAVALIGSLAMEIMPGFFAVVMVLIYPTFVVLGGMGLFGARRYMLSRTALRGVRFNQTGSPFRYGLMTLGHGLLTVLTLFLYLPVMRERLRHYRINKASYGSEAFSYDGRARDLYPRYLLCWVLCLPTLGVAWVWYYACERRYVAEHTYLGKLRFRSDVSALGLYWLGLSNFVVLVLTLGLAFPWVLLRSVRYICDHLELHGSLDYQRVAQVEAPEPRVGDGLVEALNMGGI